MTQPRKSNSPAGVRELRASLERLTGALGQQRFPVGGTYEPCGYSENVTNALTEAREILSRGRGPRVTPVPNAGDVAPERKTRS